MEHTSPADRMCRDRLEMTACLRTLNSFKSNWKPVVRDNPLTGTLSMKFIEKDNPKKFMVKRGTAIEFEVVAGVNYDKVKLNLIK